MYAFSTEDVLKKTPLLIYYIEQLSQFLSFAYPSLLESWG